jgi:hypothetical protein
VKAITIDARNLPTVAICSQMVSVTHSRISYRAQGLANNNGYGITGLLNILYNPPHLITHQEIACMPQQWLAEILSVDSLQANVRVSISINFRLPEGLKELLRRGHAV